MCLVLRESQYRLCNITHCAVNWTVRCTCVDYVMFICLSLAAPSRQQSVLWVNCIPLVSRLFAVKGSTAQLFITVQRLLLGAIVTCLLYGQVWQLCLVSVSLLVHHWWHICCWFCLNYLDLLSSFSSVDSNSWISSRDSASGVELTSLLNVWRYVCVWCVCDDADYSSNKVHL